MAANYLSAFNNNPGYVSEEDPATISVSLPAGTNRRIVVWSLSEDTINPGLYMSSPTFGGQAMTQIDRVDAWTGSAVLTLDCYTYAIPDGWSGNKTFSTSLQGGNNIGRGLLLVGLIVGNANPAQTFGTASEKMTATRTSSGTSVSGSISSVPANALVVTAGSHSETFSISSDNSQTQRTSMAQDSCRLACSTLTGASGSTTVGYSYASNISRWAMQGVALQEAPAGGTSVSPPVANAPMTANTPTVVPAAVAVAPAAAASVMSGLDAVASPPVPTLSPPAASMLATALAAGVVPGAVGLSPSAASTIMAALAATAAPGAAMVSPVAASMLATALGVGLTPDAPTLSPLAAAALLTAPGPGVAPGAVSVTPGSTSALMAALTATAAPGAITLTPAAAAAIMAALDPDVSAGGAVPAPVAAALMAAITPLVAPGAVSVDPGAGSALMAALAPTVVAGARSVGPAVAAAPFHVPAPSVGAGAVTAVTATASALFAAVVPSVSPGPLTLMPSAAAALMIAMDATATLHVLVAPAQTLAADDWPVRLTADDWPIIARNADDWPIALPATET